MKMRLNDFLKEQGEDAKVISGYISYVFDDKKNIKVKRYDPGFVGETLVPLTHITFEELNLRKTSRRYLEKVKHPVVMFIRYLQFPASETYDGVTGKLIHQEE
jgi:hypothetical protein